MHSMGERDLFRIPSMLNYIYNYMFIVEGILKNPFPPYAQIQNPEPISLGYPWLYWLYICVTI